MLRRVAFVGASHLSLHSTAYSCYATSAWVRCDPSSRIHRVRARGESSLCCGELLLSELVICHSTLPHISAMLPLRGCAAILVVGYIMYVRVASPRYAAAS